MEPLAYIPSPSQGVWNLGPVPVRAYAVMIILGIVVCVWLGERRWAAKGGTPGVIVDVAVWAVPFGLVGARVYHVLTDYQRYFGDNADPLRALEIWKGGLGIWGAIGFGAVGALIACRRRGISILALADAVAPGIVLAQGIGRWGNYWNQELYGRPLDTFWAIEIDKNRLPGYEDVATYHPTFLYEFLWCVGVAILVIWADRRYNLTHGRAFALYVAGYTLGRAWIEALRIDEAHEVLGLRFNNWVSIILFLGAVAYMYQARNRTGPENVGAPAEETASGAAATAAAGTEPDDGSAPKDEADADADAPTEVEPKAEETAEAPEPDSGDEPETVAEADAEAETGPEDAADTKVDTTKADTNADADDADTGATKADGDAGSERAEEDAAEEAEEPEGEPVKDGK
ncbi:prolipoprotein diacylglyceryl transferase [Actinomadura sp. KC216]|uniref:prolipoprotein diacylglyceryl transferase n=1 Tax=Actinomadura sp. KC216 TaxID=2530370 RepID=UPI0010462ADF|nr:prolipoprotein diacylglyceryl transferase [Actinomadura sp. KC216]TDB88071.1 prolipoprotein diacylglyceryl transferase [Actinomadura sp. KC216]